MKPALFTCTRLKPARRASERSEPCASPPKPPGDAREARLSRLVRSAALLRRHRRHSRRLAAPCRLAATGSSPRVSTRSVASSRTERMGSSSKLATSASTSVTTPVDLAAPYSNESNAGQRSVGCKCRRAAAGIDIRTYLGVVRKAPRAAPRRRGLQMPVKMGCLLPQGG